jgi:hypothetical protein
LLCLSSYFYRFRCSFRGFYGISDIYFKSGARTNSRTFYVKGKGRVSVSRERTTHFLVFVSPNPLKKSTTKVPQVRA